MGVATRGRCSELVVAMGTDSTRRGRGRGRDPFRAGLIPLGLELRRFREDPNAILSRRSIRNVGVASYTLTSDKDEYFVDP